MSYALAFVYPCLFFFAAYIGWMEEKEYNMRREEFLKRMSETCTNQRKP